MGTLFFTFYSSTFMTKLETIKRMWGNFQTTALYDAVKELLRVVLLGAVGVLVAQLEATGSVEVRAVITAGVLAGGRFIDKYLHEFGKNNGVEMLVKGLTRF